jgi:dipeptidyl aminopeptidase/acylaminoacyl peptidase
MPAEGGRVALLRRHGNNRVEVVLPAPWNVRSRVHEYGGRAYTLIPGARAAAVVFVEFVDQRLYLFEPGVHHDPRPLTPDPPRPAGLRYVEPVLSPDRREVWCVREEHTGPAPTDVTRAIVAVPVDGSAASDASAVRILVTDRHFLACPRPSPDGRRLSWIGWDHPNMPWDSTQLRVASVAADGSVGPAVTVAGGTDESIVQAEWDSDGSLLFVTDTTGWWNLHRVSLDVDGQPIGSPVNLCPREEECGGQLWLLGMQWFVPLADGTIAVIHGRAATTLGILDPRTGDLADVAGETYTEWAPTLAGAGRTVWGVAAAADIPFHMVAADTATSIVVETALDMTGGAQQRWDASAAASASADAALPPPQARTFTGPDGRDIYANVYPPHNPTFTASAAELPPYVVFVHGGPTSRTPMVYDLEIAYFTSRGLGVVDVNYRGSTGFGRAYRKQLRHNWGIVDVDDCVAVANALVGEGVADPARLAIRGGSAGGWTSAAALTFHDVFACGVIRYPVLDLVSFQQGGTHDFESRYLESLVGPWPQTADRYRDRSPINHADQITAPFVLLQGLEDEICPPAQSERFVERIAGRHARYAYLAFEGEQHGFRRKATIVAALEAELSLYAQVFGFTPAGDVPTLALRS